MGQERRETGSHDCCIIVHLRCGGLCASTVSVEDCGAHFITGSFLSMVRNGGAGPVRSHGTTILHLLSGSGGRYVPS